MGVNELRPPVDKDITPGKIHARIGPRGNKHQIVLYQFVRRKTGVNNSAA